MKKIIAILLSLMLVASLAVPAMAVTPSFTVPKLPDISGIKFDFKFKIPDSFWDRWFDDHPFQLPDDFELQEPTEATEPEVTEPEMIVLGVPAITEARYYHKGIHRLQIGWNAVDGAESYEVEVTKADGTTDAYTTNSAMLFLKNVECPRVYIEETSTWAAASVQVRALAGDAAGEWSEAAKISCDQLHF